MKCQWGRAMLALMGLFIFMPAFAAETEQERKTQQAELDAACDAVRQEKLAVIRADYVLECIDKKQRPDRESCERFYADYGEGAGPNQAPLFYDLPECVKAAEYRRSYRHPDR